MASNAESVFQAENIPPNHTEVKTIDLFGKETTMSFLKSFFGDKKNKSEMSTPEESLKKALKALDRAIKTNLDDFSCWQDRAMVLQKLGRTDEAVVSLRRAAKLNTVSTMMAWDDLGRLQSKMRKYEEAIRTYKEGIASWPAGAGELWNGLGCVYIEMSCFREALPCFEEAARLHPRDGSIWNNKGWALENIGRFNEAKTAYEEGARFGNGMAVRNLEGLKEKEAGRLTKVVEVLISGTLPDANRQRIITELQQKTQMSGTLAIQISGEILSQHEISIECETRYAAEQLLSGLQSAGCHARIKV